MLLMIDLDKVSDEIREELATTLTSSAQLAKLAKDYYSFVRVRVAQNPCTSSSTLNSLSDDRDNIVREAVASNINTTIDTLTKLAHDRDSYVRRAAEAVLFARYNIEISV